jgi:hypothetical protein
MPGNKLGKGRPVGARNKKVDLGDRFLNGDIRSPEACRFRSLLTGIINDLGGHEALSTGQLQLARRCALISTQCELMEQQAVTSSSFDATGYGILTGIWCERSMPSASSACRET